MTRDAQCDRVLDALEQVASFGVPGPGHALLLDVGTGRYREFFAAEVLRDLICQGGSTCRFYRGAYGSGKTHLLGILEALAVESGMAVVRTVLDQSLRFENWNQVTKYVLQRIEAASPDVDAVGVPAILEGMAQSGSADAKGLRQARLPHPGVQRAMLHMVDGNLGSSGRRVVARYLTGERVRVPDLRASGATGVKEPLTTRNAETFLNTVLAGLRHLGLPGVMLLMDENENTLAWRHGNQAPKRIVSAANLMRRLVDATTSGRLPGLIAVFSVLPQFVEIAREAYEALGQRLSSPPDELGSPWRWHTCDIADVNEHQDPESFLDAAVSRLTDLSTQCGANSVKLHGMLADAGRDVLALQAGPGYRRELMKRLSRMCVTAMEGNGEW